MLKRQFTLIIFLLITLVSSGQIFDPVTWNFSYEKTGKGKYELIFNATIEEGSHLYAMELPEGNISIPTSFTFEDSPDFTITKSVFQVDTPHVVHNDLGYDDAYFSNSAGFRAVVESGKKSFTVKGYVNFMACNDSQCSPPKDVEFSISVNDDEAAAGQAGNDQGTTSSEGSKKGTGIISFLILSLLAGFAGVLTPCVFPMIPMTVAFFSQGVENRAKSFTKAVVFALSIILVYSSLGIIVSLSSAGANFASTLSTHWIPNTIFFVLFIVFAASFFGAYEIILPNKWVSGADSRVDKGGIVAAFFLGLTTVLVSFSCTGPIVGALLVEASSGDVLRPTIGMFGFGFAFALPFFLFALFPSVMNKLPKSGGWLNSVKVVLGFIMLAFSLKFLSAIDTVYGLGILGRDIFLAIWIVLFSLLGLYLMGKIRFRHDTEVSHFTFMRFILVIAVFTFVVYLIPGLFGAPLKGISGLIPQKTSSSFEITRQSAVQATTAGAVTLPGASATCETPKYGDKLELPYGLQGYFDYEQGMECAREKGLPVFLDFKGHACSNCKEMEAKVWSDPEVLKRLASNFVIIALYTDDRTKLPEEEWISSSVDGKIKDTMGKVNTDLEISMFNTNTQPLYAIVDHNGKPLVPNRGHDLSISGFVNWLDEGAAAFSDLGN